MRENAEKKIWNRLDFFRSLRRRRPSELPPLKIGILGMLVCFVFLLLFFQHQSQCQKPSYLCILMEGLVHNDHAYGVESR